MSHVVQLGEVYFTVNFFGTLFAQRLRGELVGGAMGDATLQEA